MSPAPTSPKRDAAAAVLDRIAAGDPETRSADPVAGNLERLKALFPDAFAEGKVEAPSPGPKLSRCRNGSSAAVLK